MGWEKNLPAGLLKHHVAAAENFHNHCHLRCAQKVAVNKHSAQCTFFALLCPHSPVYLCSHLGYLYSIRQLSIWLTVCWWLFSPLLPRLLWQECGLQREEAPGPLLPWLAQPVAESHCRWKVLVSGNTFSQSRSLRSKLTLTQNPHYIHSFRKNELISLNQN